MNCVLIEKYRHQSGRCDGKSTLLHPVRVVSASGAHTSIEVLGQTEKIAKLVNFILWYVVARWRCVPCSTHFINSCSSRRWRLVRALRQWHLHYLLFEKKLCDQWLIALFANCASSSSPLHWASRQMAKLKKNEKYNSDVGIRQCIVQWIVAWMPHAIWTMN